jgi:hypothetical protein
LGDFIDSLLPEDLHPCREMLVAGLGGNARDVKRLVNLLTFYHQLASAVQLPRYDPRVLAILLLIQYRDPKLFNRISRNPRLLRELKQEADEGGTESEMDEPLLVALRNTFIPSLTPIDSYVYLTEMMAGRQESKAAARFVDIASVLEDHRAWVRSRGRNGERADLSRVRLERNALTGIVLREAILTSASLRSADLNETDLRRCELQGADLTDSTLRKANMRDADLSECDFTNADLRGADLGRARLVGANLRGADLRSTRGLTKAQFLEAVHNGMTKLPVRFSA